MPAAPVETVREIYEHWARGDFRFGAELFAEDLTATTFDADGDEIPLRGRAELAGWMRQFLEQWADFRQEALEITADGDRVLVAGRQFGTGRTSQVELEMPFYTAWVIRDGQVVGFHTSRREEIARRAAGFNAR
jgi:ketosteroid isomerase-like protein